MPYEFHDFSAMFPLMEGAQFDELVADIKKKGQQEIIMLYEDKILDGRNRYRACQQLKIDPRVKDFNCVDGDPLEYVWSANAVRRHLTPSQRAMAIAKRETFLGRGANQYTKKGVSAGPSNGGQVIKLISRDEAAKIADVGRKSISRAMVVLRHGTQEEIKSVETGEKKLYTVEEEISKRRGVRGRRILNIPDGLNLEQWGRKGLELEEKENLTTHEAAEKIGCSASTYARVRSIILLSDKRDLPLAEKKIVSAALEDMNTSNQAKDFPEIKTIANRVWGFKLAKGNKTAAQKLEDFEHAINVIKHSCMAEVSIPYLSKKQKETAVKDLQSSIKNLGQLIREIKEINKDG